MTRRVTQVTHSSRFLVTIQLPATHLPTIVTPLRNVIREREMLWHGKLSSINCRKSAELAPPHAAAQFCINLHQHSIYSDGLYRTPFRIPCSLSVDVLGGELIMQKYSYNKKYEFYPRRFSVIAISLHAAGYCSSLCNVSVAACSVRRPEHCSYQRTHCSLAAPYYRSRNRLQPMQSAAAVPALQGYCMKTNYELQSVSKLQRRFSELQYHLSRDSRTWWSNEFSFRFRILVLFFTESSVI